MIIRKSINKLGLAYIFLISMNCVALDSDLSMLKINKNLYVILGGDGQGANVGVSVGEQSVVLIDAMVEKSTDNLFKAIRSVSSKPVKYVVNTHDHFDHVGGNALFSSRGATIISHDSASYEMPMDIIGFDRKLILSHGEEQMEVFHVASHSPSDAIVYLKTSNVIFVGDVFATGWYPALFHGGISGQNEAIDLALSWADENTKIVPGHGDVSNKSDFLLYKNASILWVDRIMALHKMGVREEAMTKDKKLNDIRMMFKTPATNKDAFDRWFQDLVKNTIQVESKSAM
ncbi:MBL fold metallo-hydrolase [Teredinibacter waterburyi]|uniref:MBL fold metallo-hydrolase n=1 Tax=Teredinibacter waterburyi TaxID=1500538 RepID=UPI00165FA5D8|nr:MBL fold metallo-hydrolase [Teredinibacter waterburyi]